MLPAPGTPMSLSGLLPKNECSGKRIIKRNGSDRCLRNDVRIDLQKPQNVQFKVTSPTTPAFNQKINVDFSATDGTGVTEFMISESNQPPSNGWTKQSPVVHFSQTSAAHYLLDGDREYKLYMHFKDVVGHVTSRGFPGFKLDTTGPQGSILINNQDEWTNSIQVQTTITGNDPHDVEEYALSETNEIPETFSKFPIQNQKDDTFTRSFSLSPSQGEKTIYLWLKDRVGNTGGPYKDNITLDTISPQIKDVKIYSDNLVPSLAKSGDTITLEFQTSEKVREPDVSILGEKATIFFNDNITSDEEPSLIFWKASVNVKDVSQEGITAFNIRVTDLAGNISNPKTSTDDTSSVKVDLTKPTVVASSVKISSSNEIAAVDGLQWAKKDEIITLIFNTSEKAFSPKVRISGVEVNAVPRDSDTTGTQWEATYRVENILGNMLQSTNLVLRLDATNIDGNHNRGFSEGDQISNWMDLSSKGYTLNRSHNLRPTFSFRGMNGRPAVQFNGNSNLYVENFTGLSTDDYTILVVSQLASASGHQDLLAITKSDHGLLLESSGGKWRFLHRMPIANSGGSNRMGYISNTDPHVMMFERLAHGSEVDEMNFFIDDIVNPEEESTHTSILDNPNFDSGGFYLTLGSILYNNMGRPFNGSISELMIFNRGLNDLEKAVLLRHISEKWELDSVVDSDMDGIKDDMEGDEVEWSFIEVKDQAGNLLDLTSAPTSTSDNSKIKIDTIAPEVSRVSIVFDNTDTVLANDGSPPSYTNASSIKLNIQLTEASQVSLSGKCGDQTYINQSSGELDLGSLPEGNYDDCVLNALDNAGNPSAVMELPEFNIDRTVPNALSLVMGDGASQTEMENITVIAKGSDQGGIQKFCVSEASSKPADSNAC
ncbi:MAG: hypothetical protein VX208_05620, partial [SAR324 cluster bacterium]|nr:hypothetical protein [SAR324 cluster bacterium]